MKFFNLLKKELTELINKEMILGIVVICVLFAIVGQVMQSSFDEMAKNEYKINVMDCDDTDFTQSIFEDMKAMEVDITMIGKENSGKEFQQIMSENDIDSLVVIPEGFTRDLLENGDISSLTAVSVMKSASSLSSISSDTSNALSLFQSIISDKLMIDGGFSEQDMALVQQPFKVNEITVVSDKSAEISMSTILQNISVQNMIIPIIVFVLVMYTSQMIVGAISTEKIDKTLETLLSAPVSRSSVLGAKMLATAIVALINAAAFMIGYYVFIGGAMTSAMESETVGTVISETISYDKAMNQLGLHLGIVDYLLVGIQMFLTIMISLSVSIILGAMANDAKSAQSLIMPVMMCAMIPYMISMVSDINTLPTVIRTIVYAIPFTHTFTAMNNLMFGNDKIFIFGIIYQAVVFVICMFFAIKIFNSDKIFTSSLNLGQKSRLKKKAE